MMGSIFIQGVTLPLARDPSIEQWDILVIDGIIAELKPSKLKLKAPAGIAAYAANGLTCAPGFIDMHCHLREPGQTYKEDLVSGSRAAARGGFTTVVAMANTSPPIDNPELLRALLARAKEPTVMVNVLPVGCVTMGQKGEYLTDFVGLKKAGAIAFSDDGVPVASSRLMVDALKLSRIYDVLLLLHEEDQSLSHDNIIREGEVSYELGIPGYHSFSEELIVIRDLHLTEKIGGRIHLCHMASRYSLPHIERAKANGVRVTAEVTPHHLLLTSEECRAYDPNYKMSPPLGHPEDREALMAALKSGVIDCIATDHAPHAYHEKEILLSEAKCGITGFETAFASLLPLVRDGTFRLVDLLRWMSERPAKILGLENRGRIEPGAIGDLVLFDPQRRWVYSKERVASKSLNSPFLGREFQGEICATVVAGRLVYDGYRKGELADVG